jgi:hypothetical protein
MAGVGHAGLQAVDGHVECYIAETRFCARLRGRLKSRQEKVIARMFEEGVDGWEGTIAHSSPLRSAAGQAAGEC